MENYPIHAVSRMVDECKGFSDQSDCHRFIFQLYSANVGKPAFNIGRHDIVKLADSILQGEKLPPKFILKEHKPLVSILDFALVINHYHLYLLPNIDKGVSVFMRKLNNGFAKYFNLKHGRKGALFGSRYKSIVVKTDLQSNVVSRYINVINPLDVFQPGWREEGLKDWEKAFDFLKNYQFSSFPDKVGERKSLLLAPADIQEKYIEAFSNKDEYSEFVTYFLKERLSSFQNCFIE